MNKCEGSIVMYYDVHKNTDFIKSNWRLFNIYNRQKNMENSRPYKPSDSVCTYVHT